jgi:YVTN family beta-propeller protein
VDGFPCDDGRTCISSDTCQTGVCRGNAGACGQTTNVTVGGSLQEVLLSRDGTRLYAANYATDAIDVVDVASAAWIDTIPTLPGPTSFAISRDGSTLFVSYTYQKHTTEVTRVDVATHAQTGHLPMATSWGTDPLAISGDGSRLYAGLYPYGPITEIQSSPFSATGRSYAANVYDAALTVSPDATMLWVGNIETGNTGMRIINLATSGSTGVSLPGGNAVTVFAPDGTSAYVRSHSGNGAAPGGTPGLYISDVSPSGIVLSSTSVAPIGSGGKMAVSPNGQRLVLTTQNSILIVDALTKTVLEVISASSPYGVAASNSQAFIGDVDHIVIVPLP